MQNAAAPDLELLAQLEQMRQSSPEEYEQLMSYFGAMAAANTNTDGVDRVEGHREYPSSSLLNDPSALAEAAASLRKQGHRADDTLELPGGTATFGQQGVKEKKKGISITPSKGFVVKTREFSSAQQSSGLVQSKDGGQKVFINICEHEMVQEPGLKKRLDDDGNEVEALNVPMSLGPPVKTVDKQGERCISYDIIVNPKVIQECSSDVTGNYRHFVCEVMIGYVEQKYGVTLDRKYKLPRLKYKGDVVASQFIEDRTRTPVIEEVSSSTTPASPLTSVRPQQKVAASELKTIAHKLYWGMEDGTLENVPQEMDITSPVAFDTTANSIVWEASNLQCTLENITVKASEFKLLISADGYRSVTLTLPMCICVASTTAFMYSCGSIRICLALDKSPLDFGPDPGSPPWILKNALATETPSINMRTGLPQAAEAKDVEKDPKERFHLTSLSKDTIGKVVQSCTSLEDVELPEDRFHRKDLMSQHIINQRDAGRQHKQKQAADERKELEKDPNVEFTDLQELQANSRANKEQKPVVVEGTQDVNQELQRASRRVASRVLGNDTLAVASETNANSAKPAHTYMQLASLSNQWTQLLD